MVERQAPRSELQARRRAAGYSQESLAFTIGTSVNSIRSWEQGVRSPRPRFRAPLAEALSVSLPELDRLLDPTAAPNLNRDSLQGVAEWLTLFVRAEQNSRAARAFDALAIPALLQTRPYATAVERAGWPPFPESKVAHQVETRLARQAVLTRKPEPLLLSVVFPEHVLHVIEDRQIMAGQVDHLNEMARRPNVDLRIVPRGTSGLLGATGSFKLLVTAGSPGPDLVCEDGRGGFRYYESPAVVSDFAGLFDRLADIALTPVESIQLLMQLRKEHL
jgi:transcriptional regulator with XRE-family HTH domain